MRFIIDGNVFECIDLSGGNQHNRTETAKTKLNEAEWRIYASVNKPALVQIMANAGI